MGRGVRDFLAGVGRGVRAVGRGLRAAGADIAGQMFGSTGPADPSTWQGRMTNIAANNANPMAIAQTGRAFMNAYGGGPRGDPAMRASAGQVSYAAAAHGNRPATGSVVSRGFLGASSLGPSGYGPGGARMVEPRNALGYTVGQAPGLPQTGFRMAGTDGGPGGVPTPPTRAAGATTAAAPGRPSGGGGDGLGAGLGGPVSAPRTGGYTPFGATAIRGGAARAMFAAMKQPRGERQFHNQAN